MTYTKSSKVKKGQKRKKVDERVDQLLKTLEHGVKNFSYSPEEYAALLKMKALMPNYSFRNLMLAKAQFPTANFLASFNRWKELGRYVRKGAKAIRILAPRFIKKEEEDSCGKITEKNVLIGFYPVPVFDVSQTKGEELPIDKFRITLEGDSEEARHIISLAEEIAKQDDCKVSYSDIPDGANGLYYPAYHKIVVEKALSINQRCKTLIHELVHSKVHRNSNATTEEKEIVAEGAAFVVCSFFGLDTSDYSFRYVHGWSNDKDSLIRYGSLICDISKKIIFEFKEKSEKETDINLDLSIISA